jgi:XTP/dITP diphosphohydrolase
LHQPKLLIATRNPGKLREYRQLLQGVPFTLVSLEDVGIAEEVEETGQSFQENAWLKARASAALCRGRFETCPYVLGDDSGLEVDALAGQPGIHSARYGGNPSASDLDRVELLLRKLEGVPWERRTARFRCVIAIAYPNGVGVSVAGAVAGMIQYQPEGTDGFGYDPVFYLPSYGQTMAQLPLEEKNWISHRADAARKAVAALRSLQLSVDR